MHSYVNFPDSRTFWERHEKLAVALKVLSVLGFAVVVCGSIVWAVPSWRETREQALATTIPKFKVGDIVVHRLDKQKCIVRSSTRWAVNCITYSVKFSADGRWVSVTESELQKE